MVTGPPAKTLRWIASARRDMRSLPQPVRRNFGVALYAAQLGLTPPSAKPLKGFGSAGVLEILEDDKGGTYRAVYTVRFATAVYVLHVFQKKSKTGVATPQADIDLVKQRLKQAETIHKNIIEEP